MRKVFTDFIKKDSMRRNMVIIPIIIAIGVIIAVGILNDEKSDVIEVENAFDRELLPEQDMTIDIQEKLDEIEKNNLQNEYKPKDREWITSGPFQIDRSEYVLGEKIFLRIGGLSNDEIGQVVFLMPSNGTHYTVYLTIPFNGADKTAFNYYLEPDLSKAKGICTVGDLIGDWRVVFRGTDYSNLEFKITENILPGEEDNYLIPVC